MYKPNLENIIKEFGKLFSGLALATTLSALPNVNAETPIQQDNKPSLEEKVESEKYVFLRRWGSEGSEDGQFKGARYLDIDDSGNIYVANELDNCILKFDKYGNFVRKWGSWGEGDGEFRNPGGIAIDNDFVYVSEETKYIQKFDLEGNFIGKWNIGIGLMGDLDVDSTGNVYVNIVARPESTSTTFVRKFDSDGNFLKEWGASCCGDSKGFNGIAVDNNDNVYVPCENIIRKFTSDGDFVMEFFGFSPRGLAVDNQNNLYACDVGNHCIQKFDSDGKFITRFGNFEYPWGIAIDSKGVVHISHSDHIKKFIKLPTVSFEKGNDTVAISFESPPSFLHYVFRSSDLENWDKIDVLKSTTNPHLHPDWVEVNKFYSNGQRQWLQDQIDNSDRQIFYKISVQEPDFRVEDGIEYCLKTDKLNYRHGEQVNMIYRVTNHREEPVTFWFGGQRQFIFTVEKDGKIYYASSKADVRSLSRFTLAHGEFKELIPGIERPDPEDYWIIGDYEEIGRYNLTGVLHHHEYGDKRKRYVPVTVTIDVVK